MNALSPVLILWFSLSFLEGIYRAYHGQRPSWYSPQGNRIISRLFLVLFLSQWIVGNLV